MINLSCSIIQSLWNALICKYWILSMGILWDLGSHVWYICKDYSTVFIFDHKHDDWFWLFIQCLSMSHSSLTACLLIQFWTSTKVVTNFPVCPSICSQSVSKYLNQQASFCIPVLPQVSIVIIPFCLPIGLFVSDTAY